ncbi:hypothetical protein [Plantactinospora soyae]|uniref:Uncharacterized protein n=1 Tax=Plantactinospora soyae TaxID=1544732 RepID=A0A927MBP3_9ACTN|nr:hypothetical protein [Plantactinospora soyae]MBE1490752.1 hypothetical protein [Plantactinospora soyae]
MSGEEGSQIDQESRSSVRIAATSVTAMEIGIHRNWSKSVRQVHRWLSIAFTLTIIGTFVALVQEEPAAWVFYMPLLPLVLLLLTGLYLFLLPYGTKWRSGRRTAAGN